MHPRGALLWQATRMEAFDFLAACDAIVVTKLVYDHKSPTWTPSARSFSKKPLARGFTTSERCSFLLIIPLYFVGKDTDAIV